MFENNRLETILETSTAGIISLMSDGAISFSNSRACAMFGYALDELSRIPYHHLVCPEQKEEALKNLQSVMDGVVEVMTTERHYVRKDGRRFWGYLSARRMCEPDGKISLLGTITDITELKEAEVALLKSSEQLRLALEASSDGIWDWDIALDQLYWNPRCFVMLGYEPNEFSVTFDLWKSLIHRNERDETVANLRKQLAASSDSFQIEFRIAAKNGSWRWILVRGKVASRDEAGNSVRIVGTFSDIGRRKQEELYLQYQLVIRDMVFEDNEDGFFQYMLDTAEQLTDSRIGFFHLVDDEQRNLTLQTWSSNTQATMCTAPAKWLHYPISEAGMWVECFYTKTPVIQNDYCADAGRKSYPEGHAPVTRTLTIPVIIDGKVVAIAGIGNKPVQYNPEDVEMLGRLVHFAYDIVERKKNVAQMRESEMRYSLTLAAINDGLWDWDALSGATYFSPVYYSMLGYEDGEFEASYESWRELVHPEDLDMAVSKLFHGVEVDGTISIDMRMKMKTGQWLWVCSRGKAIAWENNGKARRMVGTLADISARKAAEEQVARIEQQFQQTQKLESLGVLAGGIAHDFNNILTIILGHCYITREQIESGMSSAEHVVQIEAAANRAADLCRQMLTYAGKSQLVQSRVNLWLQVDEIVRMLRSAIKKNIEIKLDLKRNVPSIVGDESQLQQVVMNLVINSSEAIGDHHGTIYLELRKVTLASGDEETDFVGKKIPAGEYARLEVTDNGCGMDEETRKRVFEPFFTTKFTGRGLGMSVILGIVSSHGGAIQLTSNKGKGTTFAIYFPVPVTQELTHEVFDLNSVSARQNCGSTILLVDDEKSMLVIGEAMLRTMGFTVHTASDGKEALAILQEHADGIDLLILDVNMPNLGGVETYRRLREMSFLQPVIMMSGYVVENLAVDVMADELVTAIQKPFKPEQLRRAIEGLLAIQR